MTTVTKKIDTLTAATTVANNDKLVILDVSEAAVDMTKLATMSQIPISLASQLSADVVENSKIKDGAVRTSKILDGNVTYAKIQKSQNAFVLGNKASTTGTADAIVEIQPSAASQVLLGSTGTTNTVDFGKVTSAHIAAMTSAQLAGIISDETGTGKLVFGTSPTLITPVLGTPASGTLTNCTGLPASGIATMTSADLAGRVSDETGTGKLVFATSPTLVTPALGTPASGVLTNCTGLPTTGLLDNSVTEAKLGTIKRTLFLRVTAPDDTLTVGSTTNFFPFPISLNNFIVVDARINLVAASSSGTVTVALLNQGGTMTTLSLASGATGMSASGTISTSYRTAITNNFLGVNVTAAGTGAKGLSITLVLQGVPA